MYIYTYIYMFIYIYMYIYIRNTSRDQYTSGFGLLSTHPGQPRDVARAYCIGHPGEQSRLVSLHLPLGCEPPYLVADNVLHVRGRHRSAPPKIYRELLDNAASLHQQL